MQRVYSIFSSMSAQLQVLISTHYSWSTFRPTHVDLVILLLALSLFIVALTTGRSKMLFGLLAIYIAGFLEAHTVGLPLIKGYLGSFSQIWLNVSAFLVLYVLVFLILTKTASRHRGSTGSIPLIFVLPFILLELGFIISMFSSELALVGHGSLIASSLPYFSTQNAHVVWAFAPFAFLLLVKLERR